jgi:8-oxo-dGTP pyrophosphatase MutT (NUDIX family)
MATTIHPIRQAAAIPVRAGRVCLVTSRSGKRWVIPKGCLEPGHTAGQVALQEAWEEAGLVGMLHPEPVGSYLYRKAGKAHHVIVFLMQVTHVADEWPETNQRQRCWLPLAKARGRIDHPGLRTLIRTLLADHPSIMGDGSLAEDVEDAARYSPHPG